MSRPFAVLCLLLCTMLWGFAFIAQKTAMQTMGPLTFSALRYMLGTLLLAPFAFAEYQRQCRKSALRLSRRLWGQIAVLSVAFFFGTWLQQAALLTTTVTNGGFLTSLYVIFTPIVVYFTGRVPPHPIIYLGAPLALLGIYLLTGADLHRFTEGDRMLVLCAACWAVQVALLGKLVQETRLPLALSTLTFVFAALLSSLGALVLENPDLEGIGGGWIELLYAGVLSTAVAFSLQAIGQRYVPPANAAIILSTESLFAALGGAVLLGERLSLVSYIGAALIFLAILVVEVIPAWHTKQKPLAIIDE